MSSTGPVDWIDQCSENLTSEKISVIKPLWECNDTGLRKRKNAVQADIASRLVEYDSDTETASLFDSLTSIDSEMDSVASESEMTANHLESFLSF